MGWLGIPWGWRYCCVSCFRPERFAFDSSQEPFLGKIQRDTLQSLSSSPFGEPLLLRSVLYRHRLGPLQLGQRGCNRLRNLSRAQGRYRCPRRKVPNLPAPGETWKLLCKCWLRFWRSARTHAPAVQSRSEERRVGKEGR